jgi:hypothetical protein
MIMRTGITLAVFSFLIAALAASAPADTVVFPASAASTDGGASSVAPFDLGQAAPGLYNGSHYQQLYGQNYFPTGTTAITAIAFRPDLLQGQAFSTTISDITIKLSTTSVTPDTMSSTFADNFGTNTVTVVNGSLALSSANTGNPRDFDVVINLATPYLYDPSQGNLLLDIVNNTNATTSIMDFGFAAFNSNVMSRAYSFDAGDTTAASVDPDRGLVTQFTVTTSAVPLPSAAASGLLLLPFAFLLRPRRLAR